MTASRFRTAIVASSFAFLAVASAAPPAAAHCDLGFQTGVNNLVKQLTGEDPGLCFNDPIEAVLAEVNAQANETGVAYVYIEYQRFHPEVVHVPSGGHVVFLWADVEENFLPQAKHTITSAGRCANEAANGLPVPQECLPTSLGACFDSEVEMGVMPNHGVRYDLGLGYNAAAVQVERLVKDPDTPVQPCPEDTAHFDEASATVPYLCKNHGIPNPQTRPGYDRMRGAIVVWS